jgi:thiol-disulfide isomerase/thioredoxin
MRSPNRCRTTVWLWRAAFLGAAAAGAALPGCSRAPESAADTGKPAGPIASIGAPQADAPAAPAQSPEPPSGTPESVLHEAKLLRTKPFEGVTDPSQIAGARLAREKEIVRLTTEVIAKTHDDKSREETFDDAALLLMNARLQLALSDDEAARKENTDALYEHAAAFYARDPQSKAAAEAAYTVARFAHENARKHGSSDWLGELARQAQVFATKFPQEQSRAVALLYSAGWSCELHGLTKEAADCYALLVKDFPTADEAVTAAGSLRRLKLVGRPVQLGGSTFDGGYVSIDTYAGKPVLVVFWQSGNPKVAELMPVLADVQATYGDKVGLLGVALDENEAAIGDFLKAHPLRWQQIFFADKSKRGWKNTVAEFYGVKTVPSVWLVGPDGKVRSTNLTVETARQALAAVAK